MKLKKLNAILGLLSILFILLHVGYSAFWYLTFNYSPVLENVFAYTFLVFVCLHAVCGMLTVFMHDEGRMDLYPKQNVRTILQRVSAALILPLLIVHIKSFGWMSSAAENGKLIFVWLLIFAGVLFFADVLTHVATSFTKGLITLGLLSSEKTMKILDRICYIVCAIVFALSIYAITRVQIAMFLGH